MRLGFGLMGSFVRSLTMDTWKEGQILKMKFGGNTQCGDFFEKYGLRIDIKEYSDLKAYFFDKYDNPVADCYKSKLKALSEVFISIFYLL